MQHDPTDGLMMNWLRSLFPPSFLSFPFFLPSPLLAGRAFSQITEVLGHPEQSRDGDRRHRDCAGARGSPVTGQPKVAWHATTKARSGYGATSHRVELQDATKKPRRARRRREQLVSGDGSGSHRPRRGGWTDTPPNTYEIGVALTRSAVVARKSTSSHPWSCL